MIIRSKLRSNVVRLLSVEKLPSGRILWWLCSNRTLRKLKTNIGEWILLPDWYDLLDKPMFECVCWENLQVAALEIDNCWVWNKYGGITWLKWIRRSVQMPNESIFSRYNYQKVIICKTQLRSGDKWIASCVYFLTKNLSFMQPRACRQ